MSLHALIYVCWGSPTVLLDQFGVHNFRANIGHFDDAGDLVDIFGSDSEHGRAFHVVASESAGEQFHDYVVVFCFGDEIAFSGICAKPYLQLVDLRIDFFYRITC